MLIKIFVYAIAIIPFTFITGSIILAAIAKYL